MPRTTYFREAEFKWEIENLKTQRPNLRIESCSEDREEEEYPEEYTEGGPGEDPEENIE